MNGRSGKTAETHFSRHLAVREKGQLGQRQERDVKSGAVF